MNICFLTVKDFLGGAGVEKYSREVGRRLVDRGHQVSVYSSGGTSELSEWQGIRICRVPKARPHWLEKMCASLFAAGCASRGVPPDVFHFHGVGPGAMALFLAGRAPAVLQLHGVEWQRSRWGVVGKTAIKLLEPCAFFRADGVTAVSQVQCRYYGDKMLRPIEFIPTAAEIKPLCEPREILSLGLVPGNYVLFASRLVEEKGLHYLLDAFRSLPSSCSLVVAGNGPETSTYVKQIKKLGAQDRRIKFIGHVNGRLLEELFSNAAAFIQPSEIEGLAIALLEAMSYGNVCIASDIPENLEAIGDAGLPFRSKNADDLRVKLQAVLQNPSQFASLRAAARERVARFYSWDRVTDDLERLYCRVIAGRKAFKQGAASAD